MKITIFSKQMCGPIMASPFLMNLYNSVCMHIIRANCIRFNRKCAENVYDYMGSRPQTPLLCSFHFIISE